MNATRSLHIHDVVPSFPLESVEGIEAYNWRALLLKGDKVVGEHPCLYDYLTWLKEIGIGNNGDVFPVPSNALYECIQDDPNLQRQLRQWIGARGLHVRLFARGLADQLFLEHVGLLSQAEGFNPHLDLADQANDKAFLRKVLDEHFDPRWAPFNLIVNRQSEIMSAIKKIAKHDCDFIVVKAPHLASGEGMDFFPLEQQMSAAHFAAKLWAKGNRTIIIEAGYRHDSFSTQWEIRPSELRFIGFSQQIISQGRIYQGSIISSDSLLNLSLAEATLAQERCHDLALWYQSRGYVGTFGIDFIVVRRPGQKHDGELFLLEINGRVTGATYPFSVGRQLADQGIFEHAIATSSCHPKRVEDWRTLVKKLGSKIFNGRYGVIPFLPNLLPSKIALMAVDSDVRAANFRLEEAQELLGN
ncbi:hypothetical protein H6761_00965 [Candidatus Nomurabacteria bacterium]|nr:hypothetical protein [Candidatus Nomurabacteria bacterium]